MRDVSPTRPLSPTAPFPDERPRPPERMDRQEPEVEPERVPDRDARLRDDKKEDVPSGLCRWLIFLRFNRLSVTILKSPHLLVQWYSPQHGRNPLLLPSRVGLKEVSYATTVLSEVSMLQRLLWCVDQFIAYIPTMPEKVTGEVDSPQCLRMAR